VLQIFFSKIQQKDFFVNYYFMNDSRQKNQKDALLGDEMRSNAGRAFPAGLAAAADS
jgi:hypothetical protein